MTDELKERAERQCEGLIEVFGPDFVTAMFGLDEMEETVRIMRGLLTERAALRQELDDLKAAAGYVLLLADRGVFNRTVVEVLYKALVGREGIPELARRAEAAEASLATLRADLEAMTKDRDRCEEADAEAERALHDTYNELLTLRAAVQQIEPYVRHASTCHIAVDDVGEYINCYRPLGPCDCGFADALARLSEGRT